MDGDQSVDEHRPGCTVDARIRQFAALHPAAPAILAPGRSPLDYRSLVERIDRFADALAARGVRPGDRVAVMLPKGPDMAVAFYGVTAIATAAPIDPAALPDWFAYHVESVHARTLVTWRGLAPAIRECARQRGLRVVDIDWTTNSAAGAFELVGGDAATGRARPMPTADDHFCVLLTSGTTSRAKVVPITHRNMLAAIDAQISAYALTPADRTIHVVPMHYGGGLASGLSVPLCAGSSIVIPDTFDPGRILDQLAAYGATWYHAGYTVQSAVLAETQAHPDKLERIRLRFIRSASGRLEPAIMQGLEAAFEAPVIEGYSMTEAIAVAINPLPPGRRKPGCVGRPLACEIRIIDDRGRCCSAGQAGEIVFRGDPVFAGYEGDAEANAAAFIDGWFRSGDVGRLDEDGYLWIVGRLKEMINRGGQKVAPFEVEEALSEHPDVASTACFSIPHPTLGEEVAAAVVPARGAVPTEGTLRKHAMRRLAPYKVPRRFVFVDDLPRTANGKVRRLGLADELGIAEASAADGPYKPPATATERRIAGLFEEILERENVSVDTDFFLLGGDSLSAVRLFLRIEESFGVSFPHSTLFEWGSVQELAAAIDISPRSTSLVSIQPEGARPPFFCVHDGTGQVLSYGDLARCLGADQPFYALQSQGLDGRAPPLLSVEDMAERYIEEIRRLQPHGPYLIGGYSFGGHIAFEMGCRLRERGETVALLALIDIYAPTTNGKARASYLQWARRHVERLAASSRGDYPAYLGQRLANLAIMIRSAIARRRARRALARRRATGVPIDPRHVREINALAGSVYRPSIYPGDVVLFCGELYARAPVDAHDAWQANVAGRLVKRAVSGNHVELIKPPHVEVLARELRAAIDEALARKYGDGIFESPVERDNAFGSAN